MTKCSFLKLCILLVVLCFSGCNSSNSSKHLDKLRNYLEGVHETEHGKYLQTISYSDNIFKFNAIWIGNDNREDKFTYSFELEDLDFETMKSNSMFVKGEIWINCWGKSTCLVHSDYSDKKFNATTIQVHIDNNIEVINTFRALMFD